MNSLFVSSLRAFLTSESIDLSSFVQTWSRICDVPPDAQKSPRYTVRSALNHINTFRNRFAHVPFPYDGMDVIANSLEEVTEQLFSIDPKPFQSFVGDKDRTESPLTGAIVWRDRTIRGTMPFKKNGDPNEYAMFFFPALQKKLGESEQWEAAPFLHIDSMLRPYVLTRLKSNSRGVWEFTRFRAEANSVVAYEDPKWLTIIAVPAEADYVTADDNDDREVEDEAKKIASEHATTPANAKQVNDFGEALRLRAC